MGTSLTTAQLRPRAPYRIADITALTVIGGSISEPGPLLATSAINADHPPPVMDRKVAGAQSDGVQSERSREGGHCLQSAAVEEGGLIAPLQQTRAEGDNVLITAAPCTAAQLGFQITREEERYSRWMSLYDRTIRFPAHGTYPVGMLPSSFPLLDCLISFMYNAHVHTMAGKQIAVMFCVTSRW